MSYCPLLVKNHNFYDVLSQKRVILIRTVSNLFKILSNKMSFPSSYLVYIEDIHIFGMNMPFISSSEAKNAYFMSGEATNEIYIFLLHEMK